MSKEIYVVNCYTCQHNGQETCKGCNTLLNGDVEPYENWELREDLSQKDQHIAELEQELAEYKELQDRLGLKNADEFEWFVMLDLLTDNEKNMHILDLHRELAELKEKAIVPKFKVGQNIFFIDNECQIAQGVVDVILTGQDVFEKWCKYSIDLDVEYEDDIRFIDKNEEEIFATKEETQDKLKEMKGNE